MRLPAALLALAALPAAAIAQAPDVAGLGRVAADAEEVSAQTYVVRAGDTLSHIVLRTHAGADAIARANGLVGTAVRPGQKLRIPAGRYHRVARGQSGIAIARAYGVDWSRIATLNNLDQGSLLREGDRLLIPSMREVAGMSMEERARAFTIDIDDLVTGSQPALARRARPAAPIKDAGKAVPASEPVAEPDTAFAGRFLWPIAGGPKARVLRPFGPLASGARSDGVNLRAKLGAPILAAADGVVAYVGSEIPSLGGLVILRHGDNWVTVYGHASRLLVQRGQRVRRGQVIARSGDSGFADRPELHFEMRRGRTPVDPLAQLPRS